MCAEEALKLAESRYKDKLINIHIFKDDQPFQSLK